MERDPASCLPHGLSFRFVDRVLELRPGERIVAVKTVTAGDPYLQGHVPGGPIMPGVLLVEAMAQTAGLLLPAGAGAVLAQVRDARFRRSVAPGDRLRLEVVRLPGLANLRRFHSTITVDGHPVAEAEVTLAVQSS